MSDKQLFVQNVDEVATEELDNLGDVRYQGGKVYKYVKYSSGTANLSGKDGDVVVYSDYKNNEVTPDNSDGGFGAGVLQADVEDGEYCWVLVKGFDTLSTAVGGSGGDDDPLTTSGASDRAMTRLNDQGSATAALPQEGVAVDASEKEVVVDFPL